MTPRLETERLVLRGLTPADFEPLAEFYAGEEARFVGGPLDRVGAWRQISASVGCWALRGYGEFAVEEKASGRLAGLVGPWYPEGWPEPEIAWIVLPQFHRMGYGYEAAARAIRFAYEELGWVTAVSCIAAENVASMKLAEKLGAVREGEAEFKPYGRLPFFRHLAPAAFAAHIGGRVH